MVVAMAMTTASILALQLLLPLLPFFGGEHAMSSLSLQAVAGVMADVVAAGGGDYGSKARARAGHATAASSWLLSARCHDKVVLDALLCFKVRLMREEEEVAVAAAAAVGGGAGGDSQ